MGEDPVCLPESRGQKRRRKEKRVNSEGGYRLAEQGLLSLVHSSRGHSLIAFGFCRICREKRFAEIANFCFWCHLLFQDRSRVTVVEDRAVKNEKEQGGREVESVLAGEPGFYLLELHLRLSKQYIPPVNT